MRILTLSMQVPDSRATVRVAADGLDIDTRGVKLVCNPFDEYAVEQAVQLRESRDDVTEIAALTVGGATATEALRTALAMGADRAIHVCLERPSHDELYLAQLAAAAIGLDETGFELILCGKQTIDHDAGELGPAIAEFLGLPHVGAVAKLELADNAGTVRVRRRVEGAEEVVETPLPVLITCEKGLVEPRFPSLPNLMKAKKKPMQTLAATDLPGLGSRTPGTTLLKLAPPPEKPACRMIEGDPPQMARELIRLLREEAKVI